MPDLAGFMAFRRRSHKYLQGKLLREYYGWKASLALWTALSNLTSSQLRVSKCDSLRRAKETSRV
jgi:hypothetical protein